MFVFSSFKLFLELEPQLRDIIHKFYDSKYASCLKLLDDIKVSLFFLCSSKIAQCLVQTSVAVPEFSLPIAFSLLFSEPHQYTALKSWFCLQDNLLLDMYLAPHVNALYTQIRNRALCQVRRAVTSLCEERSQKGEFCGRKTNSLCNSRSLRATRRCKNKDKCDCLHFSTSVRTCQLI